MTTILDVLNANGIAGFLGSVAAIATKPPLGFREGIFRCISGLILALMMTTYTCEWIGIDSQSFSKINAISAGLGFAGFHALTALMIILDAGLAKVNDSKLGVIPDIIDFLRGKKGEK